MANPRYETAQIIQGSKNLGNNFWTAVKNFPTDVKTAWNAPSVAVAQESSGVFAGMFGRGARVGAWMVGQPIAWAMKPVKWTIHGLSSAFGKHPVASVIVTGGAALLGAGTMLSNHFSDKHQNTLQAETEAAVAQAQQMQAVLAAQQAQMGAVPNYGVASPAPTYNQAAIPTFNSVSPAEYAAMEAKMRGGAGNLSTDNAARFLESKQASAQATEAVPTM